MASLSPEEAVEKAQAEFVNSAVQDVHYGPESLSDFTQWRVGSAPCPGLVLLAPGPEGL